MKSLKDNLHAVLDLSTVIMIGIAFAGMMVIAYIIWSVRDNLMGTRPAFVNANNATNLNWNSTNTSISNVTSGFDNAFNLILVAITIFILAIAISALLMLRGRQ